MIWSGLGLGLTLLWSNPAVIAQSIFPSEVTIDSQLQTQMRDTTIRVQVGNTAGSGVLIDRLGQRYSVLTNRHVIESGEQIRLIAPDDRDYPLATSPQLFPGIDLALLQFDSPQNYPIAPLRQSPLLSGEVVYAAGFPLYIFGETGNTVTAGRSIFRLTQGQITFLLNVPLSEGYSLGYNNPIAIGMSGGPIFDRFGTLVGLNGRSSGRDPSFGVYTLADGTVPDTQILETLVNSSLGIPFTAFPSQFLAVHSSPFSPVPRDLPLSTDPPLKPLMPNTDPYPNLSNLPFSEESTLIPASLADPYLNLSNLPFSGEPTLTPTSLSE